MEWIDDGIVLGVKRHGETSIILELMTRAHGRHLGLVRGGSGSRLRGILQPGNTVRATWRARLDEHLGNYRAEAANLRAAGFMDKAHALHGVTHLAALCRLLAEREPHTAVYDALEAILDRLEDPHAVAPMIARFELDFLAELGFGLDLAVCAATGTPDDLVFVSPRSGRAVSRVAGEPYRDKLMRLPVFLRQGGAQDGTQDTTQNTTQNTTHDTAQKAAPPSPGDLADAFVLTGFFLERHAFSPRGLSLPEARAHFLNALTRERH